MIGYRKSPGCLIRTALFSYFVNLCLASLLDPKQSIAETTESQTFQVIYVESSLSLHQNYQKSISVLIQTLESSTDEEKNKDCSEISSKINARQGSILIIRGIDQNVPFISAKCFPNSGISRVFQVSEEELSKNRNFPDSKTENFSDFEFRIFNLDLICKSGKFEVDSMSCRRNIIRELTDLNTTYQSYKNTNSVPVSISLMKNESITVEFFNYLVEELKAYADTFSCSTNNMISASNYLTIHQAISDLLLRGLVLGLSTTKQNLDNLFDISQISLCTEDFAGYSTLDFQLVKPAVYYLESSSKSIISYPESVKKTFSYFVSFIKKLDTTTLQSLSAKLESTGSVNSDKIQVQVANKEIPASCFCTQSCPETFTILEMTGMYTGLGFASDIYAYEILKAELNNNPATLQPNCLEFNKVLKISATNTANYRCLIDNTNSFKTCDVKSYNRESSQIEIKFTEPGIFAPIQDCDSTPEATSNFMCCSKNCVCDSIPTCNSCKTGWVNNADSSVCSTCGVGYKSSSEASVTCDACIDGYAKAGDICGSCRSNCLCTLVGGCKSCLNGYFFKTTDNNDEMQGSCVAGDHYVQSANIVSKSFDPSLAYITLTFSYAIKQDSPDASCSYFFVNSQILGTGSLCSIQNFKSLLITLGNNYDITDQSLLKLSQNFLLDTSEKSGEPVSLSVSYSVQPKLTAVISGPSKVTLSCTSTNSFVYSGSMSYGPQKLSLSYNWAVLDSPSGVALNPFSKSEQVNVTLSSGYSSPFKLKLTVVNHQSLSSNVTLEITVENDQKLIFSLDAGSGSVFKKSADVVISRVNSELCGCSSLTSAWSINSTVTGLDLLYTRFRIPGKKLDYGYYAISLVLTCGSTPESISGSASISIQIVPSELVLVLSKSDQIISQSIDLIVDGSYSYDPDGDSLTYQWSFSPTTSTPSIIIPSSALANLESFTLTFTISAGQRSASQTLTFKIIPENPLKVSILGPQKKVSGSSQVVIRVAASAGMTSGTIIYEWTQISGISVSLTSSSSSALWFSPGLLTGGTAYTFQYKASLNTYSVSVVSSFIVNKGAKCESVAVSPTTGSKGAKISVMAFGCADSDNSDYPLVFKVSIKRTTRYSLLLTSYSSVFTGLTFPSGKTYVLVEACDSLKDCWSSEDQSITLTRFLRQMENRLENVYNELKDTYGTVYAILFMLTDKVDENLIQLIWNDFVDEVNTGSCSDKEIIDVIFDLVGEKQDTSISRRNLKKYINFLTSSLSEKLDNQIIEELEELAIRVSEIDKSSNGLTLSLILMQKVLNQKSFDGLYYNRIFSKFELFIIEDVFSQIDQINKLSLKFDLSQTGFKKNDIVRVEIVSKLSEDKDSMFSINAYSSLYSESGEFFTNEPILVLSGPGCKVSAKDENWKLKRCSQLELGEWKSLNCDKSYLIVNQNGIYRVQYSSEDESTTYSLRPEHYAIFTLFSILIICIPLFKITEKNARVHPRNEKESVQTDTTSSPRNYIEYDYRELRSTIFSKHLFLSIFTANLNLSRIFKLIMFLTVVFFMIFIQVALLGYTSLNFTAVGFLSSFIAFPVLILLVYCFKQRKSNLRTILIASLVVVFQICCSISVFFMESSNEWIFSFIISIAVEIIITETLLMVIRLKFKLR